MCLTANSSKLKRKKWNWLTISDKLVRSTHANFCCINSISEIRKHFYWRTLSLLKMFLLKQLWLNANFFHKLKKSNLALRRHVVLLFKSPAWLVGIERDARASHQTSHATKTGTIHLKIQKYCQNNSYIERNEKILPAEFYLELSQACHITCGIHSYF